MSNDLRREIAWWDALEGDEIEHNTAGNPPYDLKPVVDRIVDTLTPGQWVDLGCGAGRLTDAVARRTYPETRIIGIDFAPNLIEAACTRRSPGVFWILNDGANIPDLPVWPLSGVYSVTLFQHIAYDYKLNYVAQVFDLLEPGGKFLFTVSVGDEPPTFLNHQLSQDALDTFCNWITTFASDVTVDKPDDNGWTWVTVAA